MGCCVSVFVRGLVSVVLFLGKGMWILTKLGFTAVGIAAGSLAAAAMAVTGNVRAGSAIARATSVGMRAMW